MFRETHKTVCAKAVAKCCKRDRSACVAQLAAKRPVSPHVFEIDGKGMHYKMPINAVTSIMNRVTGTVLTLGARCVRLASVSRLLLTLLPNFPVR